MSALVAEFDSEARLVAAAHRLHEEGLTALEAYTPYPVEGLDEALPRRRWVLPVLIFTAGMLGVAGGAFMQWYGAAISFPINIGGRPDASWPAFIPIAFEIGVGTAVSAGFFGFMALARLPKPYQPIQAVPGFERASQDRFFLTIDAGDPRFDAGRVTRTVEEFAPCSIAPWPS